MQTTINPAPERGQQFTLTAETDADRELLDVIDANGLHSAIRQAIYRAPNPSGNGYITTGATLLVDRQHPTALETQTARQFLRAARQLCSLGLAQDTFNRHIGADAIDPEAQDQFAAVLEKLQLMLDVGARAIGKQERIRQEVNSTHCGLLCGEKLHHTTPPIGTHLPDQGGTLGAIIARRDGTTYGLIVADSLHERTGEWGNYGTEIEGAKGPNGAANTGAMAAAGSPIAQAVRALTLAGHSDWYIPSRLEMLALYECSPELFSKDSYYWTSSQFSRNRAFCQAFEYGYSHAYGKGDEFRARPVRSIQLQPSSTSALPTSIAEGDSREILGTGAAA